MTSNLLLTSEQCLRIAQPSILKTDQRRPAWKSTIHLFPEVRQWCRENGAVPHLTLMNDGCEFAFTDDLKAMLFKLRWL